MSSRFAVLFAGAALVAAGALSFSVPAFATSITIGSGMANTTVTYSNAGAGAPQNTGLPTTGTASVISVGYATPIAGTSYVSYDPNTETTGDNGGLTVYTTTFNGNFAGGSGSITLAADDSAVAYLNGTEIATTGSSSYNTIIGPVSFTGDLVNGTNTLVLDVTNANGPTTNGGPTNVDFKLTAAATPEPSSLVLLGTGLAGVAGTMRRKIFG